MGVEFRLGHGDHKVVEDFLAGGQSSATAAITLDPKAARVQRGAADAAREAGVNVFYDPATERLASEGYGLERFPAYGGRPYSIEALAADSGARSALVHHILGCHPDFATHITPPHFYVSDPRTAQLNLHLLEQTWFRADRPVRPILTIGNQFARSQAAVLAAEYARLGTRQLELRLSPFGGSDESLAKIRRGFAVAQAFTDAGIEVTLGQSGNLGQIAMALGHVTGYSVGIGMREKVDHASMINRQKKAPRPKDDDQGGGPTAGVYLPAAALTVSRATARLLMANTDLRLQVGCRIGQCATTVNGPLVYPREHYLHSRNTEAGHVLGQPLPWRASLEIERLRRALAVREFLSKHMVSKGEHALPVRTLQSLIADIARVREAS